MTSSFQPPDLTDFTLSDQAKVLQKLQTFAQAGASKSYYLFDFDRTLTTAKYTGTDTSTWNILHNILPAEGRKLDAAIQKKYLALEAAGQLTTQDSQAWTTSQLNLHTTHSTSINQARLIAKKIKLRAGTTELFAACDQAHIPTVILSGGIHNVIEAILEAHHISPAMLISVQLQLDDAGRVIGWDKDSLVLTHNKNETIKQRLAHIYTTRPCTVLIGDTTDDPRTVDGDDQVLRIRVCDEKLSGAARDQYLQASFAAGYDMVLEENFNPLIALTHWLTSH